MDKYNYRNKMEFSYSSNKWIIDMDSKPTKSDNNYALGLHVKNRYDKIVDINDCYIHGKKTNEVFKYMKTYLFRR